ncbi:phosphate signaling complex protein PhoU [Fodinisporobacter ferrooxydans]|uniref:Phosphate-specific transport system accessory protein PhoU n=1 Tax=Fodinisporobacter ferrooxydans TaxID=2901836 RepID=A0ABY4CQJ6_9BACL|nr:phosphate signaling complex protein PhoU [Alicyclobacillaceae bacterium MYW30-H2]
MSNRQHFDAQLRDVKQNLTKMGVLVEESLAKATQSLKELQVPLALEVIADDRLVNKMEQEIDSQCATLIATQQPVATDLRKIISAIRIASDLERIGDLAVDIAKVTKRLDGETLVKPLVDIPNMARIAQQMIRDSIRAYIDEDIRLAKKMCEDDHQVDKMYKHIVGEILEAVPKQAAHAQQFMQLLFAGRYIERIADHATNIGESVVYIATGVREDLNQ